ncbi:hypothetical protein T458_24550 [Brevibacillus panacihumi W25]|uniref:Uncharacterized protein n=2 Tax=Brevibacillus panacihumi TaxID=497735 RepID=V6M1G4_9BACL|nr:hypothetical protein T458_24550 [Brevibacillus panacihumi W25]
MFTQKNIDISIFWSSIIFYNLSTSFLVNSCYMNSIIRKDSFIYWRKIIDFWRKSEMNTLNNLINKFETDSTKWRVEFEKAYVEWVDLDLINVLLQSIDCSVRFLCEMINDTTRWPSKINKGLKTVSYPRIRDAADFLGIPPWLLFNHKEKNSKLKELFENTTTIHQPLQLPYFSEHKRLSLYEDFLSELSIRVNEDDYYFLSSKLEALFQNKNYSDVITGNWKALATYLMDIRRDFSGGATFSYRNVERSIFNGHLRVNFATHQKNHQWSLIKSGWLALDMEQFELSHDSEYHSFLSTIVSDTYWIFEHSPWIFNIDTPNKQIKLLTWHSLRKSDVHFESVSELINRKLPEANFTMNIQNQLIQDQTVLFVKKENIFADFIQLIKEDVPHVTSRHQKKRRSNTLQILFDNKVLHHGDEIILIPPKKLNEFDEKDPRYKATIVKEPNKILVQWHSDGKVYSISGLTRLIFNQSKIQHYSDKTHLNGNIHWRLLCVENSLYSMAEDLISSQKI